MSMAGQGKDYSNLEIKQRSMSLASLETGIKRHLVDYA